MPNEKLQSDIERLARTFAADVTRLVAEAIVAEVQAGLARPAGAGSAGPDRARVPRPPRRAQATLVERWVPDRRARRVPKFVLETTGLATKREIVERYGEHAIFQKGQPAPPPLRAAAPAGAQGEG
jgi:hypothetical protein